MRQGHYYLGKFPIHTRSVGLISNLHTGFILPQFHVIHDTKFQTVKCGYTRNAAIVDYIGSCLVQDNSEIIIEKAREEQESVP